MFLIYNIYNIQINMGAATSKSKTKNKSKNSNNVSSQDVANQLRNLQQINTSGQLVDTACLKGRLTASTVSTKDLDQFANSCKKRADKEYFGLPCNIQASCITKIMLIVLFILIIMYVVYMYKFKKN
jgi:hypothetical protein